MTAAQLWEKGVESSVNYTFAKSNMKDRDQQKLILRTHLMPNAKLQIQQCESGC